MSAFRIHHTVLPFAVCLCLLTPLPRLLGILCAVLLHEAGHFAAIALCRAHITSVIVLPFGAQINTRLTSPAAESLISAAGCMTNLLCALLFSRLFPNFASYSLALGVLNLLPVHGLDGGVLLENLLLWRLSPPRAEAVSRVVSCVTLFFLWAASAYFILTETANLSLFLLCVFLFFQSSFSG